MDLTFRSTCLALLGIVALGCGSSASSSYPPDNTPDGGSRDATGGGADVQKPPPMSGGDNLLLFAGASQLLASGPGCTGEAGAVGDRWCGFTADSKSMFGRQDLFVVNVSQVAAGATVRCGNAAGDPNCLRLTGGFFEEAAPPVTHAAFFRGDTLVYYDLTGIPYGWRPGMANGRVLATNKTVGDVHDCLPARKGTGLVCLQGPLPGDPTAGNPIQNDLLVGRLDAAASPPLVRADTVITSNTADGNFPRFEFDLPTAAGDTVAWSSRATATGPEILKTQNIDDPSTQNVVGSDVTQWSMSADDAQWYWLSQFNATSGTGVLQRAAVSDPSAPATLISSVAQFGVAATGGVVTLTSTRVLQGIADPVGAPATITDIDTGVAGLVRISSQGHVAYAKGFDSFLRLIDLYVNKLDGTGTRCTLTTQLNAPVFASFPPGSGAVLWARVDLNASLGTPPAGLFTNLSTCQTTTVATLIQGLSFNGDTSVLFSDESDGLDATLRRQNIIGGSSLDPNPPTLIQTRVNGFETIPAPSAVLFTVSAQSADDGLYLHLLPAP